MKDLATAWTQHIHDSGSRANMNKTILNETNNLVLMRLRDIVKQRRTNIEASERNPEAYDSPNWEHKQAHNNGMRQAFKHIEDLLSFVKE